MSSSKLWHQKNKEKVKEHNRKYRINHKEKIQTYRKEYYSHPEVIAKEHARYLRRRRKFLATKKKQYYKNIEESRKRAREYRRRYNQKFIHSTDDNGKLIKIRCQKRPPPGYCELCERTPPGPLQWHHWEKDNPSLGLWLCAFCHIFANTVEKGFYNKYVCIKELAEKLYLTEKVAT